VKWITKGIFGEKVNTYSKEVRECDSRNQRKMGEIVNVNYILLYLVIEEQIFQKVSLIGSFLLEQTIAFG
jgi:hypothetical protein